MCNIWPFQTSDYLSLEVVGTVLMNLYVTKYFSLKAPFHTFKSLTFMSLKEVEQIVLFRKNKQQRELGLLFPSNLYIST